MVVLPGLVRQLFWPSWKEDVGSAMIMQILSVCQRIMNKQDRIPRQLEMFGGSILDVIFIHIFGSHVWVCQMTRSVRNALQSVEGVKVIHHLPNEEERHMLKHRHLVPMQWSGFDWRSLGFSESFSWCWSFFASCQQQHQQGLVHHSRWEGSQLVEHIWSAVRFCWL